MSFAPRMPIPARRAVRAASLILVVLAVAQGSPAPADPVWEDLPVTPFSEMQAVDADGSGAWTLPANPASPSGVAYKLVGVVLNNPGDMLDSTPNYIPSSTDPSTIWQLGGMWQVFIQAVEPNDYGGSALWMGQNYGNTGGLYGHFPDTAYSYPDDDWLAEIARVSLHGTLKAGDLVEVRARAGLFHAGKLNCNEQHDNDPNFDFDVVLLQPADADSLPSPTPLTLSAIKTADDLFNSEQAGFDIADRADLANPEHYQATLVELQDVWLLDAVGWSDDGTVTVTDGVRTLPMKLGLNGFDEVAPPTGTFDVVGIFDQEGWNLKGDYRLWVMDAGQFGEAAIVPEPGTAVLAALGAALCLVFRVARREVT